MMELKYSEKNMSVCHNQRKSTQTDQELSPDICVKRPASNRMSLVMFLFSRSTGITIYLQFKFLIISKLTYCKNRRH